MRLLVGVVDKAKGGIGEAEPIEFLHVADAEHLDNIAVGNKTYRAVIVKPIIIVLHNHQVVTGIDLLFAKKDTVADALIEQVGALVAAGDHHHILERRALILAEERLHQVFSHQAHHVWCSLKQRELGLIPAYKRGYLVPQRRGIAQDARQVLLTNHFGEFA